MKTKQLIKFLGTSRTFKSIKKKFSKTPRRKIRKKLFRLINAKEINANFGGYIANDISLNKKKQKKKRKDKKKKKDEEKKENSIKDESKDLISILGLIMNRESSTSFNKNMNNFNSHCNSDLNKTKEMVSFWIDQVDETLDLEFKITLFEGIKTPNSILEIKKENSLFWRDKKDLFGITVYFRVYYYNDFLLEYMDLKFSDTPNDWFLYKSKRKTARRSRRLNTY